MKTFVTSPISLGNETEGKERLATLQQWALDLGLIWNGQPSISKLIQHLADERRNTTATEAQ